MIGTGLLCLVAAFFFGGVLVWLTESLYPFFSSWLSEEYRRLWAILGLADLVVLFFPVLWLNFWVVERRNKGFLFLPEDDKALRYIWLFTSFFGAWAATMVFGLEATRRVMDIVFSLYGTV